MSLIKNVYFQLVKLLFFIEKNEFQKNPEIHIEKVT